MQPAAAAEALPTELNPINRSRHLELAKDKLTIRYVGQGSHAHDIGAIQANRPVPRTVFVYYYECTVVNAGTRGSFALGLAERSFDLARKPGWDPNSFGYHAEDGRKFAHNDRGESVPPGLELLPTAALHSPNETLIFNFGAAPFAFDLAGEMSRAV
ncbi:hypothetical protein T492DRAFT_878427 [Pavlovales sp. CCMP2436]|nr:hypothetical protein T492DRAFT_878427 [Pavlovales sp. CCMP2436]